MLQRLKSAPIVHKLHESPQLHFHPVEVEEGRLSSPVSATFIFAVQLSASGAQNFGLEALDKKIDKDVRAQLIEPSFSFFEDIVPAGLGRLGRPFLFAAESQAPLDAPERIVVIERPEIVRYRAEGHEVELSLDDKTRASIRWAMRDGFALFESGHLFYELSFVPLPEEENLAKLDEYALLRLHKLVNPAHEQTGLRESLRFAWNGESLTLDSLVCMRLGKLAAAHDHDPINGVKDILGPYALNGTPLVHYFAGEKCWDALRSLLVAIESNEIIDDLAGSETSHGFSLAGRPERKANGPHIPSVVTKEDARLLALAGLFQSVMDFPFQSESEIRDSFDARFKADDFAAFIHPKFLTEVTRDWRTLHAMNACLGTCPYLLLTQLLAVYNEMLLDETEAGIDRLLYEADENEVRTAAIRNLFTLAQRARRFTLSGPEELLYDNLNRRIRIFRDLIVFRAHNVFRYRMERELFAKIVESRQIDARYDNAVNLMDRYQGLIKDTHDMHKLVVDRLIGWLLLVIAVLSLSGFAASIKDLFDRTIALEVSPIVFAGLLIWVVVWVHKSRES